MKKFNKIFGMTAVAAATFSLASCQNELDGYVPGGNTGVNDVSLVRTPDVIAWSGQQLIGNTIVPTTRGNQEAPFWNGHEHVKPADITEEEQLFVEEYFRTHEGRSDAVEIDFSNFYVQQLSYGDITYELGDGGTTNTKSVINQINTGNQSGDNIFSGNDQFNKCRYIFDSSTLDFWYNNTTCGVWHNNFKMVYIPGYGYYVGFDGEGKTEEEAGANKNQIITNSPDGLYYDRIIKIVPADENGNIIPTDGDNNVGGDDNNGGNTGGDNSDDNNNGGNTGNGGNVTNRHDNEVEVNYAILDSHQQYSFADLVTKLSIHVRKATDVEIKIPIPAKYLVESDDLFIFTDHTDFVYNDQSHSVTYNVGGKNVSLKVTIGESSITVETNGIDQDVINYCWETNQDGINFEVYNYFQSLDAIWNPNDTEATTVEEANRNALFKAMNEAKIEFLDENPNYFINAFGADITNNEKHEWHATVTPSSSDYSLKYNQTTHLNGTSFNDIYVKAGAPIDVTHRH